MAQAQKQATAKKKTTAAHKAASKPRKAAARKKAPAAKKKTTRKKSATGAVSVEERHRMIAEAAYYKALERGPEGTDPYRDWIEAEAEIDALLLEKNASSK